MGAFGLTPHVGSELPHAPPALGSTGFSHLPGAQAGSLVLLSPSQSSGCSQSLEDLLSHSCWCSNSCERCPAPQTQPHRTASAAQGCDRRGEHQEAAPAELQQEGKDSSQPAHALYKTCCFCLIVFSKCSLLKPLSYCGGFHLKYMFRLVT